MIEYKTRLVIVLAIQEVMKREPALGKTHDKLIIHSENILYLYKTLHYISTALYQVRQSSRFDLTTIFIYSHQCNQFFFFFNTNYRS